MTLFRSSCYGLAVAALFLCIQRPLQACSVCGCGDPLAAAGTAIPMAGQLRLSLDGEYLYVTAAGEEEGTTESLAQMTLRPVLAYSPNDRLTLVLQAPWVRKNWWTNDAEADLPATENSGLGDIDLGARWFFWQDLHVPQRWSQDLALSVGSSLPSGASAITVDGALIDQHAQLGTGALGPYVGLLYGYNGALWSLSANVGARYRLANKEGYQYGQALTFGLGARAQVLSALSLSLGLDGRYADYDHDRSSDTLNGDTGGTLLALTPGFGWQISEELGLSGRVQWPVYSGLFGTQQVTPTSTLTLQYLFDL